MSGNSTLKQLRAIADLSYWFPKLLNSGVPMPKTEIIKTNCPLSELIDDDEPEGLDRFFLEMRQAVSRIGVPCFLRTGQTSGKHDWKDTCYLESPSELPKLIFNLIEYSECVDLIGLDYSVWAVRELLPTEPAFYAFRGMPITKERRYFAENGRVICFHPYWFEDVFESLTNDELKALRELNIRSQQEINQLTALTQIASHHLEGAWSFDWLWTKRGWYLIDCAPAEISFHFPTCRKIKEVSAQI
jgi:hypothetical protein